MNKIKNYVEISFEAQYIHVDGISYDIKCLSADSMFNPPYKKDKIQVIIWDKLHTNQTCINFVEAIDDTGTNLIFFGKEKYNDWVQPYVDLFEDKKDEEQHAQEEYNKFENRQARALTHLNDVFEQVKVQAHLTSSLGFDIDANQTANENITGLLVTIGDGTTQFCDYNNVFHEVNKADLETMQTEIIQNAQYLYQQKWSYRTQIEECADGDALDEILAQIEFKYKDFTQ